MTVIATEGTQKFLDTLPSAQQVLQFWEKERGC